MDVVIVSLLKWSLKTLSTLLSTEYPSIGSRIAFKCANENLSGSREWQPPNIWMLPQVFFLSSNLCFFSSLFIELATVLGVIFVFPEVFHFDVNILLQTSAEGFAFQHCWNLDAPRLIYFKAESNEKFT